MSQLVITKALAKADYTGKQAHVELAARMKQRDAGSAPALGDRVAYVIIKGYKGNPAISCSRKGADKEDTHLQALRHMKSLKTLYTFWRTISQSIRSIIWITNSPSPSCVSSNLSWGRRLPRCVRGFSSIPLSRGADPSVAVSGDHTRTIQIATPTVGGLMKFAVKTRTCLGCKTALKSTNSVPGEYFPSNDE